MWTKSILPDLLGIPATPENVFSRKYPESSHVAPAIARHLATPVARLDFWKNECEPSVLPDARQSVGFIVLMPSKGRLLAVAASNGRG